MFFWSPTLSQTTRSGCQKPPSSRPGPLMRPGHHPHRKRQRNVTPPFPTRLALPPPPYHQRDLVLHHWLYQHIKNGGRQWVSLWHSLETLKQRPVVPSCTSHQSKPAPVLLKDAAGPRSHSVSPPGSPGICLCLKRCMTCEGPERLLTQPLPSWTLTDESVCPQGKGYLCIDPPGNHGGHCERWWRLWSVHWESPTLPSTPPPLRVWHSSLQYYRVCCEIIPIQYGYNKLYKRTTKTIEKLISHKRDVGITNTILTQFKKKRDELTQSCNTTVVKWY